MATDEDHEFAKMCRIREAARHVKAGMGSRVSRDILRKAAPVPKEFHRGKTQHRVHNKPGDRIRRSRDCVGYPSRRPCMCWIGQWTSYGR